MHKSTKVPLKYVIDYILAYFIKMQQVLTIVSHNNYSEMNCNVFKKTTLLYVHGSFLTKQLVLKIKPAESVSVVEYNKRFGKNNSASTQ